jgi:hypothetical protein
MKCHKKESKEQNGPTTDYQFRMLILLKRFNTLPLRFYLMLKEFQAAALLAAAL